LNTFRLPAESHIGHVHLLVSNLERALAFYGGLLGFQEVERNGATVILSATGQPPHHILITELPDSQPKPYRTTGLFHVAIRLPDRYELARIFKHLLAHDQHLQGLADHGVSEALYLADPDGNGIEIYADRPRSLWSWRNDQVTMTTDPLDTRGLLETAGDTSSWKNIHPETDIGHVHLRVSDLARAEAFYHDLLGLDVTQRDYPGALFLSAGGYHHHVGLNIWAGIGAPPPPPNAVGLRSFALSVPDEETWRAVKARMNSAGAAAAGERNYGYATGALFRDSDGNGIELLLERDKPGRSA